MEGSVNGSLEGLVDGMLKGLVEGSVDGLPEGLVDGMLDGLPERLLDGKAGGFLAIPDRGPCFCPKSSGGGAHARGGLVRFLAAPCSEGIGLALVVAVNLVTCKVDG